MLVVQRTRMIILRTLCWVAAWRSHWSQQSVVRVGVMLTADSVWCLRHTQHETRPANISANIRMLLGFWLQYSVSIRVDLFCYLLTYLLYSTRISMLTYCFAFGRGCGLAERLVDWRPPGPGSRDTCGSSRRWRRRTCWARRSRRAAGTRWSREGTIRCGWLAATTSRHHWRAHFYTLHGSAGQRFYLSTHVCLFLTE